MLNYIANIVNKYIKSKCPKTDHCGTTVKTSKVNEKLFCTKTNKNVRYRY